MSNFFWGQSNFSLLLHFSMPKTIKNFFVFSMMLMLIYNVSGLAVTIEHSSHHLSDSENSKQKKSKTGSEISQDNDCQCALHFQMNHILLPELALLDFPIFEEPTGELPQPKVKTYRCLLDYFSSRAPPAFS